MEDIIKIGEKEVKISNNVAWTMEYRDQFQRDVLESMMPIIATAIETVSTTIADTGKTEMDILDIAEAIQGRTFELMLPMSQLGLTDAVVNVFWAMAKAADESIAPPKKWVRQFEEFPLDIIVPKLADMILKGFSSAKNRERLREMVKTVAPQPKKKPQKKK